MKSSYLFLNFLSVYPLDTVLCCVRTFSYPSLCTEVRGKLDKSVLSFQHVGPEAQTAGCLPRGREFFETSSPLYFCRVPWEIASVYVLFAAAMHGFRVPFS